MTKGLCAAAAAAISMAATAGVYVLTGSAAAGSGSMVDLGAQLTCPTDLRSDGAYPVSDTFDEDIRSPSDIAAAYVSEAGAPVTRELGIFPYVQGPTYLGGDSLTHLNVGVPHRDGGTVAYMRFSRMRPGWQIDSIHQCSKYSSADIGAD